MCGVVPVAGALAGPFAQRIATGCGLVGLVGLVVVTVPTPGAGRLCTDSRRRRAEEAERKNGGGEGGADEGTRGQGNCVSSGSDASIAAIATHLTPLDLAVPDPAHIRARACWTMSAPHSPASTASTRARGTSSARDASASGNPKPR